jgi:nucleoside-diphosphate-sugar epimerase
MKRGLYLVTGGTGFLGSALVKRLLKEGHSVRVFDNNSRGNVTRLADVMTSIGYVEGDIRDATAVRTACKGVQCVIHLAYVNGTEFFYSKPDLVLEVGVVGMVNVINGCKAENVREFFLASTSEVYQTPPVVPTPENVPLVVPDPFNPRYSYGGGKIICELMAVNFGRKLFDRMVIFRPHNVYSADMGSEHVIPQFIKRFEELCQKPDHPVRFPIQGNGQETRAFVHVDDFTDGLMLLLERGEHMNVYNIGTSEEVSIAQLATEIGRCFGREVEIVPGALREGGTLRRCPDISKISKLGYKPHVDIRSGIERVVKESRSGGQ